MWLWHHLWLPYFITIGFKFSETTAEKSKISCSTRDSNNNPFCNNKPKRYFLYDVNPGEGFNLRRDIYVRLSPLINKLNREDKENQWILVLPPWGDLPHWKDRHFFPWSTFFDLEKIQEFVPSTEFIGFLEDYGMDNSLDMVFQLQHFPFDNNNADWREKIELNVSCERKLSIKYHLNKKTGFYTGHFWRSGIAAKNAECLALRGQASTLLKFLLELNYTSVMFDRAEVILWDSYGGREWWEARKSLQFSKNLVEIAEKFLQERLPHFNKNDLLSSNLFLGVHLRRQDFLLGRKEQFPSIRGAASQIFQKLKYLGVFTVFVATDSLDEDKAKLYTDLKSFMTKTETPGNLIFLEFKDSTLTEGQVAIVDQIICSWSTYFIGTTESTFTLRIFEEREIFGFDSNTTFNYFCPDDSSIPCKEPSRWKIKH